MKFTKLMGAGTATATAWWLFPLFEQSSALSPTQALVLAACIGMAWGAAFITYFEQPGAEVEILRSRTPSGMQRPQRALPIIVEADTQTAMQPTQKRNARQQFEGYMISAISTAWLECTQQFKQADLFSIDVQQPVWYSYAVVFPLRMTQRLPTPEVQQVVAQRFVMALRGALSLSIHDKTILKSVTAELQYDTIEVSVPSPAPAPSMHVRTMLKHARAGVDLSQRRIGEPDIWGMLGVDNTDTIRWLSFPFSPVTLFVGKTQSGKTAAMFGTLASVLAANGPDRVHVYVIAARTDQWESFARLPHVKAVTEDADEALTIVTKLAGDAKRLASFKNTDKTYPSTILVLDDMSGITAMPTWDAMLGPVTYLTLSGGGARFYTLLTTHRITESMGLGKGGRGIAMNAGTVIATNTGGGIPMLASHLGITNIARVEAIGMPRKQQEAVISVDGGDALYKVRTIYMKPEEAETTITHQGTNPCARRAASANDSTTNGTRTHITDSTTIIDNEKQHKENRGGGFSPREVEEVHGDPEHANPVRFSRDDDRSGGSEHYPNRTENERDSEHATNQPNGAGPNGHYRNGATKDDGIISPVLRQKVIELYDRRCYHCHGKGGSENGPDGFAWHVDHLVPWARGGSTVLDNLVLACRGCNQEKGDKTRVELFLARIEQLGTELPKLKTYVIDGKRQYAPTAWQKIRMYVASRTGMSTSAITEALGRSRGDANKATEQWIAEGEAIYTQLKQVTEHDSEASALIDEIERSLRQGGDERGDD